MADGPVNDAPYRLMEGVDFGRDVLRDDGSGADQRARADANAADDSCSGAERRPACDDRGHVR